LRQSFQAAAAALKQCDKFIPNALHELERRFRFEPQNQPPPMPAPKTALISAADVIDFFGALPSDVDLECIADWRKYIAKWPTIPDRMKKMGIGMFWNDPEVIQFIFCSADAQQLRKYATWWGDRPTLSVAVERAFGIMRSMEGQQRLHLSDEAADIELRAKVNS